MDNLEEENWQKWQEDIKAKHLFSAHFETLGQTITMLVESSFVGTQKEYRYSFVAMGKVLETRTNASLIGAILAGVEMAFMEFNAFKILSIDG